MQKNQAKVGWWKIRCISLINRHRRGQNRKLVLLILKKMHKQPTQMNLLKSATKKLCSGFVVLPFVQKKRTHFMEEICSIRGFLFEKHQKITVGRNSLPWDHYIREWTSGEISSNRGTDITLPSSLVWNSSRKVKSSNARNLLSLSYRNDSKFSSKEIFILFW